jgi:hypothetical protein
MKKNVKKVIAVFLVMSMMLLQGCSITEPETSHLVKLSEDGKTLTAELKASTDDGYEWQYLFNGNQFSEESANYSNNIFSNTYGSTYTFIATDTGKDTFYLLLVKDGDYDTAKVFSYELSVDNNSVITIEKEGSYLLASDIKLYKIVTGTK